MGHNSGMGKSRSISQAIANGGASIFNTGTSWPATARAMRAEGGAKRKCVSSQAKKMQKRPSGVFRGMGERRRRLRRGERKHAEVR